MSDGNPLPRKTIEHLSVRPLPAPLDARRNGPRISAFDSKHEQAIEPPLRRRWWLALVCLLLIGACAWCVREGYIAAAIIVLVFAVLAFGGWYSSDADLAGRQLHLDFEHDTATLIIARGRRKDRHTWRVPIEHVRLILCPVEGVLALKREGPKGDDEFRTFRGVAVFAWVPGGCPNPEDPGWMMLNGGYDYRELLAELARDLPEFAAPERHWETVRGVVDRELL